MIGRPCLQSSARFHALLGRGSVHLGVAHNRTLIPPLQRLAGPKWMSSTIDETTSNCISTGGKNSSSTSGPATHSSVPPSNVGSSTNAPGSPEDESFRTVYVHPLSQHILKYLQDSHHDWVEQRGLDRALTVHRDGSFELKFVSSFEVDETERTPPSTGTSTSDHAAAAIDAVPPRIWTSYDGQEKKHWLTVQKDSLHQRFLLQDNLLPAWHGNRNSPFERIHLAVDEMIRAVDRLESGENKQQQPS